MGYWHDQTLKFGFLAGMYQLGKEIREEEERNAQQQAPVQEVEYQEQPPVQEVDTGFEGLKNRSGLLGEMARSGKLRRF